MRRSWNTRGGFETKLKASPKKSHRSHRLLAFLRFRNAWGWNDEEEEEEEVVEGLSHRHFAV